jgi:DNA-binding transcriptional ArsR family regulator
VTANESGVSPSEQFAALADARRREIFEMLAARPCSVGELASRLPVTRSAVSQHLRVLKDAGLVTHRALGTTHIYEIDRIGVAALRDYLDSLWQRALRDFKAAAEASYKRRGS